MKVVLQQDLGQLAQSAIAKYLQQAVRYEKAVLADKDAEDLHQMRVGMRRLRTALQVFTPGVEVPKPGQADAVGKVARKLGRLRDLDVIAETLQQQYSPHLTEAEQTVLAEALQQLERDRHKRFKQVKKLLKGGQYHRLKQTLKDWLAEPNYGAIAPLPAAETVPDLILPLVSQLWLHPGWLVGTQPSVDGPKVKTRLGKTTLDDLITEHNEVIHSLRKQIKGVRYQLKLVSSLYGPALDQDIENLATMQDTLGHLQDSLVMGEFLESVITAASDRLPTLFGLLAESRHQAWKTWQKHQQHYLKPATRQQLRLVLAQPVEATPTTAETPVAATNSTTTAPKNSGRTAKKTAKTATSRRTKAKTRSRTTTKASTPEAAKAATKPSPSPKSEANHQASESPPQSTPEAQD